MDLVLEVVRVHICVNERGFMNFYVFSSVQFNSHLFLSPIGARTLKMPVPYYCYYIFLLILACAHGGDPKPKLGPKKRGITNCARSRGRQRRNEQKRVVCQG